MSATLRLDECLNEAAIRLAAIGIDAPRHEARLLMGHWLGRDPAMLLGVQAELVSAPEPYFDLVARRARHEPLSHLVGWREFWSLSFEVSNQVLDPRPDSEVLVESVLKFFTPQTGAMRLLDLGTGSGCLILSVLHELFGATGIGVDVSGAALEIANRNARNLSLSARVAFVRGDWGAALSGSFDGILANPPYIPTGHIMGLAPDVADFEPHLALDGGVDGLDCFRALAADTRRLLAPGGKAFFEIGEGQEVAVEEILRAAALNVVDRIADLAGRTRCLIAQAH
ncbi:MAG: peptide chain release factor N(5)-glutamine methyltransferase [Proteobacteria bacterium]|nr:peptide chain release factor N(5)-glutamine methyltransferase [Pseudomonadota bacterium]